MEVTIMLSKTMKADEAITSIQGMQTEAEILAFIEGENRKTVITAADERRKTLPLSSKQGEMKGSITQDSPDFKEGVQKTKSHVTCEDVIETMRMAGKKI
jgi:hypothetical protein